MEVSIAATELVSSAGQTKILDSMIRRGEYRGGPATSVRSRRLATRMGACDAACSADEWSWQAADVPDGWRVDMKDTHGSEISGDRRWPGHLRHGRSPTTDHSTGEPATIVVGDDPVAGSDHGRHARGDQMPRGVRAARGNRSLDGLLVTPGSACPSEVGSGSVACSCSGGVRLSAIAACAS
jgi:hypothetical protein